MRPHAAPGVPTARNVTRNLTESALKSPEASTRCPNQRAPTVEHELPALNRQSCYTTLPAHIRKSCGGHTCRHHGNQRPETQRSQVQKKIRASPKLLQSPSLATRARGLADEDAQSKMPAETTRKNDGTTAIDVAAKPTHRSHPDGNFGPEWSAISKAHTST